MLVAADGARGLNMFRSEQPDLVITDIIMPEKEGLPMGNAATFEH